jgi:hypothetical protein
MNTLGDLPMRSCRSFNGCYGIELKPLIEINLMAIPSFGLATGLFSAIRYDWLNQTPDGFVYLRQKAQSFEDLQKIMSQ